MTEYKFVTIKESEYLQLKSCQLKLEALESLGIDNWEGYSDAMKLLKDEGRLKEGLAS